MQNGSLVPKSSASCHTQVLSPMASSPRALMHFAASAPLPGPTLHRCSRETSRSDQIEPVAQTQTAPGVHPHRPTRRVVFCSCAQFRNNLRENVSPRLYYLSEPMIFDCKFGIPSEGDMLRRLAKERRDRELSVLYADRPGDADEEAPQSATRPPCPARHLPVPHPAVQKKRKRGAQNKRGHRPMQATGMNFAKRTPMIQPQTEPTAA